MCYADFESLRDGGTPTAADAVCLYDLSREKVTPKRPQSFRSYKIQNMISAEDAQSEVEGILNRHSIVRLPAVPCLQTSVPQ